MAVDVERVVWWVPLLSVPIHGPGTHSRNQLRRARSVAEEVADGRGAGTGGKAHQRRALVIQIPARTPPGHNVAEHFVAKDTGGKARHLVLGAHPELVRDVIGAEGLAQIPVKGIGGADQSQSLRVGVIRIRGQTVAETLGKFELERVVPAFPVGRTQGSHGPAVLRVGQQRLADRLILREIAIREELREAYGRQSGLLRPRSGPICLY